MHTSPAGHAPRPIRTAALLAIGTELTTGETRDTNGGELAAELAAIGVDVLRIAALPDRLDLVTAAFREALAAADLVVATGGLGPTPDDLTREAVAAVVGEDPAVDPGLERHLRVLFERRGMELPEVNLKQAWLIPSATSLPNPNGTAPGWWVDRPDGRVVVLLPGPPREMRPMWRDAVLPALRARDVGDGRLVRTLRTYGIGESHMAERLGEAMLRATNPVVATYAGAEWLDVRITAVDERAADGSVGRPAAELLEATEAAVRERLAGFVLTEGATSWAGLVGQAADAAGVSFAVAEWGTGGALAGLLAELPSLRVATVAGPAADLDPSTAPVESFARRVAVDARADLGIALVARSGERDTPLRAAVAGSRVDPPRVLELRLFQHGAHGRLRAGVAAAAFLVEVLRDLAPAAAADGAG